MLNGVVHDPYVLCVACCSPGNLRLRDHQHRLSPGRCRQPDLKESRSYCENIPRIYSGVIYGFCTLNAEPAPEKSLNDRALSDHENNAFPIIAIEFIGSGVLDTLVLALHDLPSEQGRQHRDLPLNLLDAAANSFLLLLSYNPAL